MTRDPHHPRTLRVVVSGVAPQGPQPVIPDAPPPQDWSLRGRVVDGELPRSD